MHEMLCPVGGWKSHQSVQVDVHEAEFEDVDVAVPQLFYDSVRACMRACVRACVHVCVIKQVHSFKAQGLLLEINLLQFGIH